MLRLPPWLRLLILLVLAAVIAFAAVNRESLHMERLAGFIDRHPGAMPAVFVVVHVATSLAFLPRGMLALAAGSLFGTAWGIAWAVTGSMAGAMAGFMLARWTNGGMLRAEQAPLVGGLLRRAETGGWRLVLITRLVPVLPHSLVNYAYGMSRLPGRDYAVGSFLGMLPQTIAFVQLGEAGASAASGEHFVGSLLWGGGLLLASALLPRIAPAWRRR
jgi:uncharacterized membrane protein YdjX (TVP38/TMEM64 family)